MKPKNPATDYLSDLNSVWNLLSLFLKVKNFSEAIDRD